MTSKRRKQTSRVAALPPIPMDTPEGIRAHAIAATIDAIAPDSLQDDDVQAIAAALGVPALFVDVAVRRRNAHHVATDDHIAEYVAWRHQLALAKAVA